VRLREALATLVFAGMLTLGQTPAAAQPSADVPSARGDRGAETRAAERRRLFVAIVGTAALLFGIAGLWVVIRRRRGEQLGAIEDEPLTPPARESRSREVPSPRAAGSVVLLCPTCRSEHPPDALFCSRDGNRLVPAREGERLPAGGVCPVCGQGFDPGVLSCPEHDEELVPAPLAGPESDRFGPSPKICPTCGVRYRNGSGFCGADGSALVTIN